AVVVVDLVWLVTMRVGPVLEAALDDARVDLVELVVGHQERVVLARELVGVRDEVERGDAFHLRSGSPVRNGPSNYTGYTTGYEHPACPTGVAKRGPEIWPPTAARLRSAHRRGGASQRWPGVHHAPAA